MIEDMRGRPWTKADRTGGLIDEVFSELRELVPGVIIERLEVTHPADDDNVYFIGDQHQFDRVQVDTYRDGQPSFLIENENGLRYETTDPTEAVSLIRNWLQQS